jgi:hypothetical protein
MAIGKPFVKGYDPRRGRGKPFAKGYDPRRHEFTREERSRGGWVAFIRFARRWRRELGLNIDPLWEQV